jgi:hypothetical protein
MASVQDHARQLLALADDAPAAEVEALILRLESWGAQASDILGDTSARQIMMGEVEQALRVCGELKEAIEILRAAAKEHGERYLGGGS